MSSADNSTKQGREIEATFTGTLVQENPNDFTFANDDGVRFNVSGIANLKVIDRQTY